MSPQTEHIREDDLESYSNSTLPEEWAVAVEMHLLICETCRRRLAESEEFNASMKRAVRLIPRAVPQLVRASPRSRWTWSWPRLIPVFAVLALLTITAVTTPYVRRPAPAPYLVNLQTMRGTANQATAPSRRPLLLALDLTGLALSPSYRIEMVDGSGYRVWQGIFNSRGAGSLAVPAQKRGTYFVRVALPSGESLREYELQLLGTN